MLRQFGAYFGGALGSSSFAVLLLIHFSVSGFLCGYLMTRLVLQQAFHEADQMPLSKEQADLLSDDPKIEPKERPKKDARDDSANRNEAKE